MANDDAWSSGWDQGKDAQQKRKNKKNDGNGGKQSGVGGLLSKILHVVSPISNLHSGGRVKKTGNYRLRKGELVLTKTQQKAAGLSKRGGKKKSGSHKRTTIKA